MNLLLYYVWTVGRYPIEQAVIVMKNFCAQNPNAASFTYVYPRRKRLLEQTLTASALKQIESECNCVSTLCWLLCLLKIPDEILNFYFILFVKIILFSIKTMSVLRNPSAFTDPKCNYINPS